MPKPLSHRVQQVRALAVSATAKNSAIMFGGNFLNAILAMVVVIFVSRALGPANFGILAVYNAVNTTIVGLTNLGLDTAAIKLISAYLDKDRRHAAVIMKTVFWLEIFCGLAILAVGLVASRWLAELLGGAHLTAAVELAFLASAFGSAAAFIGPFFVAYRRFTANALVGLIGGMLRVGLILALLLSVGLDLNNVLWSYTLVPVAFFWVGLALAPKDWRTKTTPEEDRRARHEVFHFSKWILLSYLATVLTGRLDVFLLSRFKGAEEVGLYAAAIQLCSIMPILIGAISTVLLPQVSRYTERSQYLSYIKKVSFGAAVATLALLPAVIWGEALIHLVFGSRYNGSFGAFQLMFIGYLIALFVNPLGLILYAIDKPKFLTILNYIQLAFAVGFNVLLIPMLGITGAALTFLIINAIGGIGGLYAVYRQVQKL